MTQAKVEKLVEAAKQLAQKGSWVRSGLTKWLEMWAEATSADLKDSRLDVVALGHRHVCTDGGRNNRTYYIKRGRFNVCALWTEDFGNARWNMAGILYLGDADMAFLRTIICGLAPAIDKYIAELVKAGEEYDNLLQLLPREDRDPVKLTVDYWAEPRPIAGKGWVADIIDVQSEVCATTPSVETRFFAIQEARRMAEDMQAE